MRVGVEFRIPCLGPSLMARGIPRYTQQQLREVLAVDDTNEYVLLCMPDSDLSIMDPAIVMPENVSLQRYAPPAELAQRWEDTGALLELSEHYQEWIYNQGIDVYHSTTPFLRQIPLLTRFDACPFVATFYDAIPFLFRKEFLTDVVYARHYDRTLGLVRGATRLLAISESTARDAEGLGVDRERIDLAYPMCDPMFKPMPRHQVDKLLYMMEVRTRIPQHFLFSVTYPQYTKNLQTLLRGYAQLPLGLRTEYPLVITCPLNDYARHLIGTLADELDITQDLVLTGTVTDLELQALYNRAALLVYPSRYEGFGLPIVEAMACGTPVITTTSTSMPEAAGQAASLVDAEDPCAFADAIAGLLRNPGAREELTARGFDQARRFTGERLALSTLASYQRAVIPPPTAAQDRPRIALWTPLPPLQTGIADYSAELLDALAPQCDVEVFVDSNYLPEDDIVARHRVQHFTGFDRRQAQAPFDAVVYQMGGSLFHQYMAASLHTHPGIVVLHDLVWSAVLHAHWHVQGNVAEFHRIFGEAEGEAALAEFLAIDPTDHGAVSVFLGRHTMLGQVVADSLAQIVHLPDAAEHLRGNYPGCDPLVVTMGVVDPYAGEGRLSRRLARVATGLAPEGFIVGVYGIIHPYKRLESSISGFAGLVAEFPEARLVVVGRAYDEAYGDQLQALARDLGVGDNVMFTGRVTRPELDAYFQAADVVLNLRSPLSGAMSAALMRTVATGLPAVITDLPEWRGVPGDACLRVPDDEREIRSVTAALSVLASDPALRARMGAAARAYYEREGTIQRMAARYLSLIAQVSQPGRAEMGAQLRVGAPL